VNICLRSLDCCGAYTETVSNYPWETIIMSDNTWKQVKEAVGEHQLTLGPYFAHQVLFKPRHLLFSLSRYKFASRLLPQWSPVSVLELGCNEGIGTMMLAEGGHSVLAVDFDEDAIKHAQQTLSSPKVSFQCANFLGQSFGRFNAVISLDVIEHIPQSEEDDFMKTVSSNLDDDGMCVIGTPNETASVYASKESEIGHVNLFTAERLAALMRKYFRHVFMFGINDEVVHTGFYPMCHYLMALGCGKITEAQNDSGAARS
jgi:2-polyprenyl-3-methyl-5-hydroxy-6-metoxy-1,4-benzoquinol methylase